MSNNPISFMHKFGQKLRILREKRGISLRQLAPMLGIKAYSFISEIETGKKKPSLEFVLKIAELFEVTPDQLLRDELDLDG